MNTEHIHKFSLVIVASSIVLGMLYAMSQTAARAAEVTLYISPQCGCCQNYAEYLQDNGHTVIVNPTDQLVSMSRDAGIPDALQGCHLAFIEGYAVSGHVPVSTINRLLSEQPDIEGITLPGMPTGSPGMSGRKTGPFEIYQFGRDKPRIYAVE